MAIEITPTARLRIQKFEYATIPRENRNQETYILSDLLSELKSNQITNNGIRIIWDEQKLESITLRLYGVLSHWNIDEKTLIDLKDTIIENRLTNRLNEKTTQKFNTEDRIRNVIKEIFERYFEEFYSTIIYMKRRLNLNDDTIVNELLLEHFSSNSITSRMVDESYFAKMLDASEKFEDRLNDYFDTVQIVNKNRYSVNDKPLPKQTSTIPNERIIEFSNDKNHNTISKYLNTIRTIIWNPSSNDLKTSLWARHIIDKGNVEHVHIFSSMTELEIYYLLGLLRTWRNREYAINYNDVMRETRIYDLPITSSMTKNMIIFRYLSLFAPPADMNIFDNNMKLDDLYDDVLRYYDYSNTTPELEEINSVDSGTFVLLRKDFELLQPYMINCEYILVDTVNAHNEKVYSSSVNFRKGIANVDQLPTGELTKFSFDLKNVKIPNKIELTKPRYNDLMHILTTTRAPKTLMKQEQDYSYNNYSKHYSKNSNELFDQRKLASRINNLTFDKGYATRMLFMRVAVFEDIKFEIFFRDDVISEIRMLPGKILRKKWNASLLKMVSLMYDYLQLHGFKSLEENKRVLVLGSIDDPFVDFIRDITKNRWKVRSIGAHGINSATRTVIPFGIEFSERDITFSDIDQAGADSDYDRNKLQEAMIKYINQRTKKCSYIKLNRPTPLLDQFIRQLPFEIRLLKSNAQKPGTSELYLTINYTKEADNSNYSITDYMITSNGFTQLNNISMTRYTEKKNKLSFNSLFPGVFGTYLCSNPPDIKFGTQHSLLASIGNLTSGKIGKSDIGVSYLTRSKINIFQRRNHDLCLETVDGMMDMLANVLPSGTISLGKNYSPNKIYDIAQKLWVYEYLRNNPIPLITSYGARNLDDMAAFPRELRVVLVDRSFPFDLDNYLDINQHEENIDITDYTFVHPSVSFNSIFFNNATDVEQLKIHLTTFLKSIPPNSFAFFTIPLQFENPTVYNVSGLIELHGDMVTLGSNEPTPALDVNSFKTILEQETSKYSIINMCEKDLISACIAECSNFPMELSTMLATLNISIPLVFAYGHDL